jgi:ABC-2 type transport system permease protein
MKLMQTLVRREFWEHRALWAAPLITALFLIFASAFSGSGPGSLRISIDGNALDTRAVAALERITPEQQVKIFGVTIAVLGIPLLICMLVVLLFYLADSLYAERKDRSILFWKSMPVSDSATVWAKYLTAMAVVPVLVYALSVLTTLLCYVIFSLRAAGTPLANVASWDTGVWLTIQGVVLGNMVIASLWYAPIAAFVLVASAWARRNALLWVSLPPVLAVVIEKSVFYTNHVATLIGYRLTGFFDYLGANAPEPPKLGAGGPGDHAARYAEHINHLSATPLLGNIDLWLGVAVAAGLILLAIRLRRYRDDT